MSSTLLSLFSQVSDPRRDQGKMYPLAPILLFTVLAMLAGARSYRQVHAFIRTHLERLNGGFGLSLRRAPAYSSVRFILHGLDAEEMERAFRAHAAGLAEVPVQGASTPMAVAIDGKTLRGSFDAFHDPLGGACAERLCRRRPDHSRPSGDFAEEQRDSRRPGHDCDAGPERAPVHSGRHALSKKLFEIVRDTGNHLLVQLKANQSNLFEAVCTIAANGTPADTAFSRNNGRSRQEDRTVEVFPVGDALAATEWHPFVETIIRVTRRTLLRSAATGMWDQRGEVAYYLSSAAGLPASAWGAAIRGHWGIENQNHYVRDVSCDEDRSRIRDNPGIMARARSFALNIMRKNGITNVAQALWNGALNLDHILAYKAI